MPDDNFTTNTAGIPAASAASDEYSLTVGPDGPILLNDGDRIETDVRAKHSGSLPEATKR